jgi:hypothetical protein
MRVLLVEPQYRRRCRRTKPQNKMDDESLWYPPLALMKLSRYHKMRGDEVLFASGIDKNLNVSGDLFSSPVDRIYITTLFTFHFATIVKTINFYRDFVCGTAGRIFVGGIMASLMPEDLFEETGIFPFEGLLQSSRAIDMPGEDVNIDSLAPDYSLLDGSLYAINETFYGHATRGCPNRCSWCGVSKIEPEYVPYIDLKPMLRQVRREYGDRPILKLMDNNVLASPNLAQIVDDLLSFGYGKGQYTEKGSPRLRVIDFNQGVDASFMDDERTALIARLNIKPLRIAFDRLNERDRYVAAVEMAIRHGFHDISNYMLYNFRDSPRDLYERLLVNIKLNEEHSSGNGDPHYASIYSYPMRYAPLSNHDGPKGSNRQRDYVPQTEIGRDWVQDPAWTRRFVRSIEIMKGAAHGAISPTPSLARRTIGESFEEFLANLYMPEMLLRNRNRHEKHVHPHEPDREPGTGLIEEFRQFIWRLLEQEGDRFDFFHRAVIQNRTAAIRSAIDMCNDRELKKWLAMYVGK